MSECAKWQVKKNVLSKNNWRTVKLLVLYFDWEISEWGVCSVLFTSAPIRKSAYTDYFVENRVQE